MLLWKEMSMLYTVEMYGKMQAYHHYNIFWFVLNFFSNIS